MDDSALKKLLKKHRQSLPIEESMADLGVFSKEELEQSRLKIARFEAEIERRKAEIEQENRDNLITEDPKPSTPAQALPEDGKSSGALSLFFYSCDPADFCGSIANR